MTSPLTFLLECLKLSPRCLAAASLLSAVLLFAPPAFLDACGLLDLANHHRGVLGLVFLGGLSVAAVSEALSLLRAVRRRLRRRRETKRILQRLRALTEDEKKILRYYMLKQTRSNTLRLDDGVVQGLVAAGILYRASSVGNLLEGFAYNIGETAWQHLNEHPALLEGSTDEIRCDRRPSIFG